MAKMEERMSKGRYFSFLVCLFGLSPRRILEVFREARRIESKEPELPKWEGNERHRQPGPRSRD